MSQNGTTLSGLTSAVVYTTAEWATISTYMPPKDVLCFELTTEGRYIGKMGTGDKVWGDLKPIIDVPLTPEQFAILENAGKANGVVVLDENGKIPLSAMPDNITGTVRFVADIAARELIPTEERTGLVVVLDATGDSTVTDPAKPTAMYLWGNPPGEPDNDEWVKVGESESIDVNLDNYFDITKHTLDDIPEGETNKHFTAVLKAKLDGIEEGADVTTEARVRAANAVMKDDIIMIEAPTSAEIADIVWNAPTPPVEEGA